MRHSAGAGGRYSQSARVDRRRHSVLERRYRRLRHGQAVLAVSAVPHRRGCGRGGAVAGSLFADCRQLSRRAPGHGHQRLFHGRLPRLGPGLSGRWPGHSVRLGTRRRDPAGAGRGASLAVDFPDSRCGGCVFHPVDAGHQGTCPARCRCGRGGAAERSGALHSRQSPYRAAAQLRFRRAGFCRLRQCSLDTDFLHPYLWLGRRPGRHRLRLHRRGFRLPRHRLRRTPGGPDGQAWA